MKGDKILWYNDPTTIVTLVVTLVATSVAIGYIVYRIIKFILDIF